MQHALITPQSHAEQLATLASGALEAATRQQTGNTGTVTYHNGESKIVVGPGAGHTGFAPWVGDSTVPGIPTGISVESSAGMILVAWDGSLDGGVPADFDHIQVLVDGVDAGRLTARGTVASGPYEADSKHQVSAIAWDDAHAEDGSPKPNRSPDITPISVIVSSADIDPESLGIIRTKSTTDPQGNGKHRGDLWMKYGAGNHPALIAEWWWDGTAWIPIPIALYLDQLAARDVQVDEAVIGLLSAGIIKSGTFVTTDGLVGFDSTGYWVKNKSGEYLFHADGNGVQTVGGLQTASSGDRIQLSQTLIQGSSTGGLQGIGNDPSHPYWLIWGDHDGSGSRLFLGTSPQQPQIMAETTQNTTRVSLTGGHVSITAPDISLNGILHVRGVALPVSGVASSAYADHDGSWEVSFRYAKTRYGEQPFSIAPAGRAQGLRVPVTGYWLIYGSANLGGSGTPTIGLGIFDPTSGTTETYGNDFILDMGTSANGWLTEAIPPSLQYLKAGQVVMWRCSTGLSVGGGANYLCADLMPY